ncbi:DUF2164 family protein [Brevundimonas sp.]|jgi:uncharacterized protein (DUF2164 family)|uniref:DUF2164 domain-containing protein n=1 Tax=Brevundimonas sp. TaxID=1871086 RepID=UPI0026253CB6|nr:DUF2164 family protein [Brevundimonas sp.]
MTPFALTREETADLVQALRDIAREELDQEISALQAEMLLDRIRTTIGPAFYNRGLYDAQAAVAARAEDMADAILALERPVGR